MACVTSIATLLTVIGYVTITVGTMFWLATYVGLVSHQFVFLFVVCSLPLLNYFKKVVVAAKELLQIELLKLALETVNTPIAMMTSDMKINYVNQATLDTFGYSKQELLGKNIDMIMSDEVTHKEVIGHDPDMAINETKNTQYQATAETFRNIVIAGQKVQVKHKSGRKMPFYLNVNVTKNNKMLVAAFQDMSAEIATRATLNNALCDYLSREIRNQLHPETVILEQMKEEHPKLADHITMMMNANTNVNAILSDALDVVKWESGQFVVNFVTFPIMRLFENIASYATAKGVIVKGLTSVIATLHVGADEHLLHKAAINLVSNACKYGRGLPVNVAMAFEKTDTERGAIVVTVTDNGCGMTPDQLQKSTEPFSNIRKGDEVQEGTGLGLALTKAIIEVGHEGIFSLTSGGLDKGVTAKIKVPVQCEHKTATTPPNMKDPFWWVTPHPGATADILVVDDVKMNRRMVAFAAKKIGLTCAEATDGVQALNLLQTNTYSMVFMDRQMPVMNGDEATEKARENGYTLPIVMVSGDNFSPVERTTLKRRGVTAFLDKGAVSGTRHAMKKLHELLQVQQC